MVRVKVCGMMSREDVALCAALGVDAVGFIFAPGPRHLSLEAAEQLTKLVPPFVSSVGVFAGNDASFVKKALDRCRLDVLQFSDGEPPSFCGGFGRPTIVVVHADPSLDSTMPRFLELATARAAAVMVDSRVKSKLGGTGVRVGNKLAARLCSQSALPFVLAGGLTPDNVAAAVNAVRPWGVDVRSGVECRGRKDRQLLQRFMLEVRHSGGAS